MARILLADDQPHILRVIRLALSREGHTVEAVGNGQQALERLRSADFDILITDVQMPLMDGIELCEALHRERPDAVGLTLVITAQADRDLARQVEHLPNTEFLEKPVSLHSLKGRLQRHLNLRREPDIAAP